MLDDLGFKSQQAKRFFSFPNHPDWLWGHTQPPIQWVPRVLSQDPSSRSVKLITHLQQMPTSWHLTYYGLLQNLQLHQLSTITSAAAIFLAESFSTGFLINFFSFHGSIDFNKLFLGRQLHEGEKVVDAAVCPKIFY